MADQLKREKAAAIDATGAAEVLVANPGCAMQIAAGLREIGSPTTVTHPAELLDRAYREPP
jgi:glycolate oxidase iron-sulfur subunit